MDIVSLLLTSVLISFLLVHLVQKYRHTRKLSKAIECFGGPKYIPVIGTNLSLLRAGPAKIWKAYLQRNAEYGPLFRSWMGNIPCIHLMKPQHIEVVLNSTENVEKGINYHFLKPWFGNGLLTSERSIWRKHRKLLTPAFHFSILDNFSEIFTRKSQMLADQLLPKADGKFFDVYPYLTHCALDIICETAMGVKINAMDDSNSEYVNAVYGVLTHMTERMVNPIYHSDFIYFLTKKGREHQKYLKTLHEFTEQVIREKQEKRNSMKQCLTEEDKLLGKKERVAFLDLLLGIKDLSFVDIRHEVDTFMFGGHDSSTVTSCWTIFLLGNHPDIQDEVHRELDEIFGGDERPVTANDLNQMKYLERVIKETLRLYTVAPSIGRTLTKEIVIDGHVVPPGVLAFLHLHDLHHDPENFPNPNKFDPDRFLPENTKGRHPFAYIPFSAGPRNCIGQKYGMRSVKTLLATFFRRYKVTSMKKPEEMDCLFTIFLRPQGGMHISLEVRNNNSQ